MRSFALPPRRARTSCSVLALATVLVVGASPAAAQSFQGTGIFTQWRRRRSLPAPAPPASPSTSPQAVIDWSPTDTATGPAAINFQPVGTTATFLGSGNYAVLNRINPADSTRSIALNGTDPILLGRRRRRGGLAGASISIRRADSCSAQLR